MPGCLSARAHFASFKFPNSLICPAASSARLPRLPSDCKHPSDSEFESPAARHAFEPAAGLFKSLAARSTFRGFPAALLSDPCLKVRLRRSEGSVEAGNAGHIELFEQP
jgi:hypothetical protein